MKPLKRLSKKHLQFADMVALGASHLDITNVLGYRKQTTYALRIDPLIVEVVDSLKREARETATETLRLATLDAIRYLRRAVAPDRPVGASGIKAAIDILNRMDLGSATMSKTQTNILAIGMNYEDDEIIDMISKLPHWMLEQALAKQ